MSLPVRHASVCPPEGTVSPASPPDGWSQEHIPAGTGIIESYRLASPEAEQYLSAAVYMSSSGLADFVAKNDASLRAVKGLQVLKEKQPDLCGSNPASEIEYSQPGLDAADSSRLLAVEQVRRVQNGWAVVTTYIRPADGPRRPDAEQWIRSYCDTVE